MLFRSGIMWKTLAIFAVILNIAQASGPVPGQTVDKPHAEGQKQENGAKGTKNPNQPPPSVAKSPAGQPTESARKIEDSDSQYPAINITNPPTPWGIREWITWVTGLLLVLVGFGTLCVLWRQTSHIIASERAWVTITPGDRSPKLYPAWEQGSAIPPNAPIPNPVSHCLPLVVKNVGKTPARIDEFACRYIRIASMSELPDEPNHGNLAPQGGHWIIPNDRHNTFVDLETDYGILQGRHIKDLELGRAFLFADRKSVV